MRAPLGLQERRQVNEIYIPRLALFPLSTVRRLRYVDCGLTFQTGVSAAGGYVFSCNGLYDPDITGTGHQPIGFDQMMLSYYHYCVLRSRIRVIFHNETAAYVTVAIAVRATSTLVTTQNQILEDGLVVVTPLMQTSVTTGNATLEAVCDIAKFGGVRQLRDNSLYRGDVANNPAEQSYFHLYGWDPETATQRTVSFQVLIEYEAVFMEPANLPESLHKTEDHKDPFPGYGGTSDPELATLAGNLSLGSSSSIPTGLKRPIITPPRPSVQGCSNLQAGGTALIGRKPV